MTFDDEPSRYTVKRDRLARLIRVVTVLRGHPDGIRPSEIARRIDVSPRTVYRDLRAIDEEIGVAVWSEGGRWGVVGEEFLARSASDPLPREDASRPVRHLEDRRAHTASNPRKLARTAG